MEPQLVTHPDIAGKAFGLTVIFMLALVAVYLAGLAPVVVEEVVVSARQAGGGRLYSVAPSDPGNVPVLGLNYLPPRRGKSSRGFSALEGARQAGLLKAYTVPPDCLYFTPDGSSVLIPGSPLPGVPRAPQVVFSGNKKNRRVALTFDTSEVREGELTRALIDELTRQRAPATFFVCGGFCVKNPGLLKLIKERGFEVANHSYSHPRFTSISDAEIRRQLEMTQEEAGKAAGVRMAAYFRPPYGAYDGRVVQVAASLGYLVVMWDRDTRDWTGLSAEGVVQAACANAQNGNIILMHTLSDNTCAAIPGIVKGLREKGYQLTTVSGVLQP